MAKRIGYDKRKMIALLVALYKAADLRNVFRELTQIGCLDYIYDLAVLL